jgi:hypothetical protein
MSKWTACPANTIVPCDDKPCVVKHSPGLAIVLPPPSNISFPYRGIILCPLPEPWQDVHQGKTLWVDNSSIQAEPVACTIYHGANLRFTLPPDPSGYVDITNVACAFVGVNQNDHLGWTIAIEIQFENAGSKFTVTSVALEFQA